MAPLSMGDGMAHAVQQLVVQRSLGNTSSGTSQVVTASQGLTLQCLALVFSTFSVASAILAFYWFIKMRRSFRHDLIMLLIQSDMFKALWFMLYPIVTFAYGPIENDSKFCQAQGFFLSLGIEASDFAILMIAIHTALYIFKPRTSAAEGGLYKYRYIAYTLWVIFPVTMASLAFVNENGGYVSDGTYCYLPVRPFWFRLALGWIPRYIIFIVIVAIYASIYYYVRYKFHGFSKQGKDNSASASKKDPLTKPPHAAKRHSLQPTPNLTYHGLIPDSRHSSYAEPPPEENLGRRQSILSPHSEAHKFIWGSFIAKGDSVQPSTPPPTPPSESSTLVADSGADIPVPNPVFQHSAISFEPSTQPPRQFSEDEANQRTRENSWTASTPNHSSRSSSAKQSMINMLSMFRHKPGSTQSTSPMSQLELVNSKGQNMAVSEMMRTREKIRRQLRFLFIYPLVYMAMWALPFVSHVLQYSDRYASNPPFALNCLTTIFVACQAAVDCWLFSTREKPWRHIPGNESDQNFWGSLKFWSGWKEIRARRKYVTKTGPGKTRQEMAREARQAYKRRDEELAQRRTDSLGTSDSSGMKRERSWWEGRSSDSGADVSAMSPIAEIRNPMDFVTIPEGEAITSTDKGKRVVETEGDRYEHTDTT